MSCIFSGFRIRSSTKRSSGWPLTTSTMRPSTSVDRLYSQVVPGWWIDDINDNGDPEAWARGEFAEMFPDAAYRSKFYQIDRKRRTLCCLGIHGQYIYIDPISELVIVRVAAEPIPLDIESARGWVRGFAALVRHFS